MITWVPWLIGFGWLRSSLRKTDPGRSQPYRPWHTFDERQAPFNRASRST